MTGPGFTHIARGVKVGIPLLCCLLLAACQTNVSRNDYACPDPNVCRDKASVCSSPTVRALAHDLDELENHIDRYGSVVAQQPDVWGQARLTKHRQDFETRMANELDSFKITLQGASARSDQAYFADSFALATAASAQSPVGVSPATTVVAHSSNATPGASGKSSVDPAAGGGKNATGGTGGKGGTGSGKGGETTPTGGGTGGGSGGGMNPGGMNTKGMNTGGIDTGMNTGGMNAPPPRPGE